MGNWLDAKCPKCGDKNHIDVAATVWLRLTDDGTDDDASENGGNHEYDGDSLAACCACGHCGKLGDF